jgi:hypothetical protein
MSGIIVTCMQHIFPEKLKYCNLRNIRSKTKSENLENIIVLKYSGETDHWKGYFIIPEMSIK